MRRVVGLTLTGLGVFFLTLALLLRFYLPGQVVKFPLNWYSVTTLVGHNMTYFSEHDIKELSGVTIRATSTVEGDVAAGSSTTAVWNDITGTEDITNHLPASYSSQRSAFNRRTGVLVNCCGARIGTDTTVRQSGQGFAWPFATQQKTYELFNVTLLKPWPATFQGTATVGGLNTYEFTQQINNQKFGTQAVPGSLVGINQTSVNLGEYLTATDSYWVDPVTGAPIEVNENQTISLEDSTGATRLILLQGDLVSTPQSISAAVSDIHSARIKISLVEDIGPLVGVLLGIVLLVIGITLLVSAPEEQEYVGGGDDELGGGDDELRGDPERSGGDYAERGGGDYAEWSGGDYGERSGGDYADRGSDEYAERGSDEYAERGSDDYAERGDDVLRGGEAERGGEVVGGQGGEQADTTA
jgi:hypothetical protein